MTARRLLALLVVPVAVACAAPAWAGESEEEGEALERRIDVLTEEAEALAEEGREDAADLLRRRVRALQAELRELEEDGEDEEHPEESVEEAVDFVLDLLEGVAEGEADRDALATLARALREALEEAAGEQEEGDERHAERERPEVRQARRWLAVMRTAVPAFLEAERRDLAESMEHAIRAWEVRLERRGDAEARAIYDRAPKMGHLIEMLGFAAHLYEKWGNADRAHALKETAQALHARQRESRKRVPGRERGAEAGTLARLEALEAQLAEIAEFAMHLREQVQELKKELR